MTMLHRDHVSALGLRRTGRMTIVGIAGEEPADVFEGPLFGLGGFSWQPRRVAAFGEGGRTRRRDGILGSGFFRRFVVEIDPGRQQISLHEPSVYRYAGRGQVLPIRFSGDTPVVETKVRLPNGSEVAAAFEVDTGCDGVLCLGKHFVAAHQLAPTNALSPGEGVRAGVGGGVRTRRSHLPRIQLGELFVERPAADLFLEGSPVDPPLAGHIGWEFLRPFHIIFDYSRRQMILEARDITRD